MSQTVLKKDDGCWNNTLMGETDTYSVPCQSYYSAQPDYLHEKLVFKYRKSNRPDKNQLWVSEDFLHKTCFHPVADHMREVHCIASVTSAWHWHLAADGIYHLHDVHQKKKVTFLPVLLHVDFVQNTSLLAISMVKGKSREGCMV